MKQSIFYKVNNEDWNGIVSSDQLVAGYGTNEMSVIRSTSFAVDISNLTPWLRLNERQPIDCVKQLGSENPYFSTSAITSFPSPFIPIDERDVVGFNNSVKHLMVVPLH